MDRFGPLLVALVVASCSTAPAPSTGAPAPGTTAPAAGGQGGGAANVPSGPRSVNSGVYTAAQATRGQQVYQTNCSVCHSIGDFTGSTFQQAWSGRPLGEFHQVVATMMPQTAPGSLTPQQYADVVAYILSVNAYPTGANELPTNAQAIATIQMEPRR